MRTYPNSCTQRAIFQDVKLRMAKGPDFFGISLDVMAPGVAGIIENHGAPLFRAQNLGLGVLIVN